MCGIFGFVGPREIADSVNVDRAAASMRHRGPDGQAVYREPARNDAAIGCALAHTRLAIIDLSDAGRQPMTTADGRFTLVYNGEIYNFQMLRAELEAMGVAFRSHTDSEVVLHAYARWGSSCVERLRGMFAFAVWDREQGTLFLARDHIGVKPLYYSLVNGGIAFASEVRTLLATGMAERKMSRPGLASYFLYGSVQDPLTIIDGVASLLPGHAATFTDGRLSLREYWTLPSDVDEEISFTEAVERLRPLLREAVAMQLVSDVPLGVFLSGGVDSSALVALASEVSGQRVHTFTVTFDEPAYNEEQYAAEVAAHFGCEHHRVRLPAARAADEFDHYIDALDQPSADGVNTYFVAEAAREAGLTVALSGTGGDEIFAGYPNFRRFGPLLAFSKAARAFAPLLRLLLRSSVRAQKIAAIVASGGDPYRTYSVLRSLLTPEQVRSLTGSDIDRNGHGPLASNDSVDAYSRLEITRYLRNTLLRDTDTMSMAHSLEVRVPLLDHKLVSSVLRIPGRAKLGKTNKPLLTAACGTLPTHIVARRKQGFMLPMDVWFRGTLRTRLTSIMCREDGYPTVAPQIWQAFLSRSRDVSWSRVWAVAALLEWGNRNGVARPES